MSAPKICIPRKCMDLHYAIYSENFQAVQELVKDKTLDVNVSIRGVTPLSMAINKAQIKIVDLLISNDANVSKYSMNDHGRWEPPVFTACRLGLHEIVRTLLRTEVETAAMNLTDFYHHTPLWVAAKEQKLDLVRLLLDSGAAIDVRWTWNECPLYMVTKYILFNGRHITAKLLMKNGVPVNVCDPNGYTPLFWSLKNRSKKIARILLMCGARIEPMTWSSLDAFLPNDIKSDEAFYDWLRSKLTSPRSLQSLCRHAIRFQLATVKKRSIFKCFAELPLPNLLIKYVSLEEFFHVFSRQDCRSRQARVHLLH